MLTLTILTNGEKQGKLKMIALALVVDAMYLVPMIISYKLSR